MGFAKPCTHLSATPSMLLEPKYRILIGQFPHFPAEIFKLVRFDWIPDPNFDFWNSDLKIHFSANLGQKSESCPFCLKFSTHGVSIMLILIPNFQP